MRSARAPSLPVLLLLLAAAAGSTAGLPYVHDELLWTKADWQEYKLPFPWSAALKERDVESTRQLAGPLRGLPGNSLNGPLLDGAAVAREVQEDVRRGPSAVLQQSSLEITLLDDSASQDAAAGVAQCKACGSLVKQLWAGLTQWVDQHQAVPTKRRIAAYAAELCEYEVPNDVLTGWVLLRARVQQGQGLPFTLEGDGQEFYLLSQRAQQHATPQEIEAVRKSCAALLKEDGVGADREKHLLHLASSMLHHYFRHLQKRLGQIDNVGGTASRQEAVEAVDDGPKAERTCYNRHPQCELWRKKGECEGNPVYMLGDEGRGNGWCRPACGMCTPGGNPGALGGEDAEKMAEVASSALAVLQAQACLSAPPCKWAAGAGMQQLLAKAKQGAANTEAAQLVEGAAVISGPVLSRQQQLDAAMDKDRLKESKPMLQRTLAEAVVPEKVHGKVTVKREPDESAAAKVLAKELWGQCLYVNTGWWMYQLCYKWHITQFHMTEKLDVDWAISLGKFDGSDWSLHSTTLSGLWPHHTKVPYVAQTYNEGSTCDLDPDSETGAKRAILRRTELRLMCSPDAEFHVVASEPEQCTYMVELYVPELCKVPGFQPTLPAGMGEELDGAWSGGGGGSGSSKGTVKRPLSHAADEEHHDPSYYMPTDPEDEYLDPDDEHLASTREQLQQDDLWALPPRLQPGTCGRHLWAHWHAEEERGAGGRRAPSLLRALASAYGWPYLRLGVLKAAGDALNFAGPLLLNQLLRHLATAAGAARDDAGSGSGGAAAAPSAPLAARWFPDVADPRFGYGCAALLAASLFLKAFLGAHFGYRQALLSSQLRSAVTAAVFRKAVAVNAATLAGAGSGRVQTLMSVDADRVVNLCQSLHELWSLPAQIALALWLLYTQVQYAFLAGLGLVLLLIPINRVLAGRIQAASIKMMAAKDRRVRVMLEVLRGIRAIKAAAWERLFAARVGRERRAELAALATRKYLDALCVYFWAATSLLFSLATFGLYALLGFPLTPQVVFTSLALFNVLLGPINAFPWVVNGVVEAFVSVRRLAEFLRCPETAGPAVRQQPAPPQHGGGTAGSSNASSGGRGCVPLDASAPTISIAGSFAWGSGKRGAARRPAGEPQPPQQAAGGSAVLQEVQLEVPAGTLVAVTGPVGCGKSSLLAAMLGEMLPARQAGPQPLYLGSGSCTDQPASGGASGAGGGLGGCIAGGGGVAYAAQDPWIPHASIRDVVLFGAPYNQARYAAALRACALLPDLAAFPAGDRTLVGGAGSTLSGGQRARLALARALYTDADVILLDDCMAAVDAKVGAWVLQHALLGPLLWGAEEEGGKEPLQPRQQPQQQQQQHQQARSRPRTVVVATHSPELMAAADVVLEMQGGRVTAVRHQPGGVERRQAADAAIAATVDEPTHQATRNGNDLWLSHWVSQTAATPGLTAQQQQHEQPWPAGGLAAWCSAARGGAAGVPPPPCVLPAARGCSGGVDPAHERPSSSSAGSPHSSSLPSVLPYSGSGGWASLDPSVRFYLSVLLAIAAANSVITLVRAFSFAKGGLVAAKRVHEQLLSAVLALPLAFFDATPPGRVLNRFSSDTATVDDSLPFILNILLANCASLAGVAAVLCLTQPLVLALLPPLALLYRRLQQYYRATSRELRRLEAVAKSPVYTAFSEALSGGPTIRAFNGQRHIMAAAEAAVAAQQRAAVAGVAAGSWLALRLQLMAAALAAAVAGAAVAEHAGVLPWAQQGLAGGAGGSSTFTAGSSHTAGLVGLSLSYVLPITGLLSGLLASSAETEQEMVAAERIFEYQQLGGSGVDSSSDSSSAGDAASRGGSHKHRRGGKQQPPAAAAAAADEEAALRQPLLPAAVASHGDTWLRAGHVRFDNVWLRYEPWPDRTGSSHCSNSSAPNAAAITAAAITPPSDGNGELASGSGGGGSPWVLRGLSLDIQPGSHVGVCGRTGAGKSSLLAALLRLAPLSGGRITLDCVDVATLPLAVLRGSVGVVPQHPFLFEGSVRENLDPSRRHSTSELAAALRAMALWQPLLAQLPSCCRAAAEGLLEEDGAVQGSADGLQSGSGSSGAAGGGAGAHATAAAPSLPRFHHWQALLEERVLGLPLGEGAAALSQGQQQLLALARVLLRRPRLLLLDEATSSVDPATAEIMHEVIRRQLAGCTIIEVAHRQSTLAGCQRVVVMEAGRVAEERRPAASGGGGGGV
ncbi:ABC transporter C family member 13 isoform X1 isoform A [Micractinium conductrix]|uniref:ABC-type xenobiotic transporter n=1 Tax=Micractinium conductrix TaxID=554055 RepID=A0A2P6VPY7_9CHLO|nr:ABC transporter C family member 13 isoform X1 isoform A [Micractinium conductrix]|eukprot:PSC76164.1 ABC transporter C family member 13 isoform X1 isoform A [Micractinium conductrix]